MDDKAEVRQEHLSDNKYFTPDISDIRVGYECEKGILDYSSTGNKPLGWEKYIFEKPDLRERGLTEFSVSMCSTLRVPYLTKEQIEAEGWKVEEQSLGNYIRGIKKCLVKQGRMGSNWDYNIPVEFQLTYNIKNCIVKIMYINPLDELTWFEGECKDINTLRYICKLLNI